MFNINEVQEYETTEQEFKTMQHIDDDHYIINILALHNPYILATFFPFYHSLINPSVINQTVLHYLFTAKVQAIEVEKKSQRKKKATHRISNNYTTLQILFRKLVCDLLLHSLKTPYFNFSICFT